MGEEFIIKTLADKEKVFEYLLQQFEYGEHIQKALMESSIETLADFRFAWESDADVSTWVEQIKDIKTIDTKLMRNKARLKKARHAVMKAFENKESLRGGCAETAATAHADLDEILPSHELTKLKSYFWKRYRMEYLAEDTPSDQLISRMSREIEKRCFTVYDVTKVKTLIHQITHDKKRKKIGEGLFIDDNEENWEAIATAESYLDNLLVYLLALATAGSSPIPGARQETEVFGSDQCAFVTVPLATVLKYHARAKKVAGKLPAGVRLINISKLDADERAEWVQTFRNSEKNLGSVIKEVYEKRGAHWDILTTPINQSPAMNHMDFSPNMSFGGNIFPPPPPPVQLGGNQKAWLGNRMFKRMKVKMLKQARVETDKGKGKGKGKGKQAGRKLVPGTVSMKMLDGTRLCPDFQKGSCPNGPECPKGAHKCGVVLKTGRVCGMANHSANNCRNMRR